MTRLHALNYGALVLLVVLGVAEAWWAQWATPWISVPSTAIVVASAALVAYSFGQMRHSEDDLANREGPRVKARAAQRADYLNRWNRHEPGYARCQECLEVIRLEDPHDCRNPNPRLTVTIREPHP